MKKSISVILFCLLSASIYCQGDPASFVNPFIGTGGHGHTYPGVCLPFGMVQVSPDTRLTGWDGCSGYHFSDTIVYGFSHTHLSGTGCSDYCDVLLIPTTGDIKWSQTEYASGFSHKNEMATAGYYSTILNKYNIKVELTATKRVGFHKYSYPPSKTSNVIIDLKHRDEVLESYIKVTGKNELRGYRFSKDWAENQQVYFVIRFSKDFDKYGLSDLNQNLPGTEAKGKGIKAFVTFNTMDNSPVLVKVGISAVSMEGALLNLEKELPEWDFDVTRSKARKAWDSELSKILVEGEPEDKSIFYTSLYHSMLCPNLYMDVDGQYRGRDMKIHKAEGFDYYTVFSLWDTYRAEHPLMTIIDHKRTVDYIKTFIRQYEEGGRLPIWELSGNETFCMIGYHSVPVIADAYLKGMTGFDINKAFAAMKHSATENRSGIHEYMKYGYVPADMEHESVSKTLEYAYDDWCISEVAKKIKKFDDYKTYLRRAQSYKNVFDPTTGFMRPRINGGWYSPFDPTEVNNHYTEANSWQYSFYVPQDIAGLSRLQGGTGKLNAKLDEMFTTENKLSGRDQSDITGLIGQYAHGNEPSHHMTYLYDYTGEPWKTQERVHQVLSNFYTSKPDGLIGNEDCGQMSAWYVLSAMGFYQVCPGTQEYAIGTPQFDQVKIRLENGKVFTIKANQRDASHYYIQSATLNGKEYTKSFIHHSDIMAGGALVFEMGSKPNKSWGSAPADRPVSEITEDHISIVPSIEAKARSFSDSVLITMNGAKGASIYYAFNDKAPDSLQIKYKNPFYIKTLCSINAVAFQKGTGYSQVVSSKFVKVPGGRSIKLSTEFEHQYTAGGPNGLIDGIRGTTNWRLGNWQGYVKQDFDGVLDLGKDQEIHKVTVGFLQDIGAWIWFPREVIISVSEDGNIYKEVTKIKNDIPDDDRVTQVKDFQYQSKESLKGRYVRVTAKNHGKIPAWHEGAGGDAHLFIDEIVVE